MKTYIKEKKAIAFFQEKASPDFWDRHWEIEDLAGAVRACKTDDLYIPLVKNYLKQGSTVLEGGCGRGMLVHALHSQGYKAIGIDYAQKTIKAIQQAVPELDVRIGDVMDLPLKESELDGYISVGVIEHFWDGYEKILSEMQRTLKPGGMLFISFPYMSPLRKLKSILSIYPEYSADRPGNTKEQFYQFALDHTKVLKDITKLGFELKEEIAYDGIKGFKDEVTLLKPFLQKIYDGQTNQRLRPHIDKLLRPFASHCVLLVFKKTK